MDSGWTIVKILMRMNLLISLIEAIALILGAASVEELDPSDVERFEWRSAHPLGINSASRRMLSESGLFTDFQCVSLLDYIERTGPVLSRSELSYVDGFDAELAEALSFFISFDESPPPQAHWRPEGSLYSDFVASVKAGGVSADYSGGYGAYARVDRGESFEMSLGGAGAWNALTGASGKSAASSGKVRSSLKSFTFSAAATMPGNRVRLYVGDFNMRFGQGLSQWSTMSIDDPSSAMSLIRRPTGLTTSRSRSGNYAQTGLGAIFETRRVTLTAAVTVPNLKSVVIGAANSARKKGDVAGVQALVNFNWWGRWVSCGFTSAVLCLPMARPPEGNTDSSASGDRKAKLPAWKCTADFAADFRGCIKGVSLAGEVAGGYEMPFRATLSCVSPRLAEHFRTGASLRYAPQRHIAILTSEYSARSGHTASLSLRLRHAKTNASTAASLPKVTDDFRMDSRYKFRWKENSYAALRIRETLNINDLKSSVFGCRGDVMTGYYDIWASGGTVSFSKSSKWGMVAYLEQSCRKEGIAAAYLRAGIFSVDDWNGRIYVYEHDVEGRFNVPVFYGRGVWASLFASWRFCRWGKLSARMAYFSYPFMRPSDRKPDKVEAKVLLTCRLCRCRVSAPRVCSCP